MAEKIAVSGAVNCQSVDSQRLLQADRQTDIQTDQNICCTLIWESTFLHVDTQIIKHKGAGQFPISLDT